MERKQLKSSRIKSASYYAEDATLEITFNNGSVYEYSSVPKSVYNALIIAKSPGSYFEQSIKNVYKAEKV